MGESSNAFLKIVPNQTPEAREAAGEGRAGTSPDVVFIVDAEGTVLYVNRSLPQVHQDDVLGTSFYDYVHPDHHLAIRAATERVFATGEPGGYEALGLSGATSEAWYDCRVVPTMRGGRVVSATVIARDVTLRKRVEETLRRELEDTKRELSGVQHDLDRTRRSLEHPALGEATNQAALTLFRMIMDQAGEAIFVVDPFDGQIVDANDTACRWVQHRHEDLITQKEADLRLLFPLRVPESYGDHVTETRDLARPQMFRGEHRRSDGTSFPVEVAISRHKLDDRLYVLAVARDSKSRLQLEQALFEAEDKYRALFELSRDAVYLSNRNGTIAAVNDAAVEMFGLEPDEFVGFRAKDLYVNADDIRTFQRAVAREGFVRDLEVTFARADGTTFTGLLTATLRRAGDRQVLGYQCVIRRAVGRGGEPHPPSRRDIEEAKDRGRETVLLIDENPRDRAEARHLLELAGIRVLIGESLAEALVIFKSRGKDIRVAMLAGTPGDIVHDESFAEIRRIAPHARIVLLGGDQHDERTVVEQLATANLTGIVRKPFHPLALIQRVREAFELAQATEEAPRKGTPTPRTSRAITTEDHPLPRPPRKR